ncbi:nuclease harbi1-like protein [Lasius niger]|uniref:Nuclease harbi1-like protein n=1 Tax=Lasius niger TaxID=67767 RepID=A0A0J7K5M8_LASNI|nr:nuclease harbi1-like protein [Lasius niger]
MTDHEEFFAYTRLWPEQYKLLLKLVTPYLRKRSIRKPLSPNARLAITLTYLAQGDTVHSKHLEYRIGKSTVYKIIPEVCNAIWLALQPVVLPRLNSEDWKKISEKFFLKWQFPNCIGALDGRHMEIQAPPCSGTEFYNYKGYFSISFSWRCVMLITSSHGLILVNLPDWFDMEDEVGRIVEGRWRTVGAGEYFKELSRVGPNRAGAISLGLRNYLKDYFVSPAGNAQAPWQFQRALRGYNINLPA